MRDVFEGQPESVTCVCAREAEDCLGTSGKLSSEFSGVWSDKFAEYRTAKATEASLFFGIGFSEQILTRITKYFFNEESFPKVRRNSGY